MRESSSLSVPLWETHKYRELEKEESVKQYGGILVSLGSIPAVCLRGRRRAGRCPECGHTAEHVSGAVFEKNHSYTSLPALFSRVLGRGRKVFFTFGGVSSSISAEELRTAVRLGDVFDNRYHEREALVYLHDSVTYYTKTHQLAFLSSPALPPAPL